MHVIDYTMDTFYDQKIAFFLFSIFFFYKYNTTLPLNRFNIKLL